MKYKPFPCFRFLHSSRFEFSQIKKKTPTGKRNLEKDAKCTNSSLIDIKGKGRMKRKNCENRERLKIYKNRTVTS